MTKMTCNQEEEQKQDNDVPIFRDCEVLWDRRRALGHGSFCSVYELKRIALRAWHVAEDGPQAHPAMRDASRKRLAEQVNQAAASTSTSSACDNAETADSPQPRRRRRWALKHIRDDLDEDEERLVLKDLQNEWCILKTLPSHPHVIFLHGIGLANYDDDGDTDTVQPTFLILGFVPTTLAKKMDRWTEYQRQQQEHSCINMIRQAWQSEDPVLQPRRLWKDRLALLPQLADALAHIHQHRMVYRDVKVDNVGIDETGIVKLFDFGLAKVLPQRPDEQDEDAYQLTGNTGTLIYMAPEVQRSQPYGRAVDVYSLAILMHQVLSLEPCPFDPEDDVGVRRAVLEEGYRPALPDAWPQPLRDLMTLMWKEDPIPRPSARSVSASLTELLQQEAKDLAEVESSQPSQSLLPSLSWTRCWTGKQQ